MKFENDRELLELVAKAANYTIVELVIDLFEGEIVGVQSVEKVDDGSDESIRCAIFRAAAEIGRAMP